MPLFTLDHRIAENILNKQSLYIFLFSDKNNAFVLLKQLEYFALRVYFHSFPLFHEIQENLKVLGSYVYDSALSTSAS